jgi:hypothetical protein
MVSDKSKANLAKGRVKGIKRKSTANKVDENNTFAAIFHFIESCALSAGEWETLDKIGITKELVKAAGITNERKLKKCLNIFLDDAPATVKEYLQRSEPQANEVIIHGAIPVAAVDYGESIKAMKPKDDENE